MTTLRRLSWLALAVAYTHLVFGAIVRISGSGMGCGENWPKCYGHWFPPLDQPTLVIEWTHRLLASILITTVTLLAAAAWAKRGDAGVSGRGGVLRTAAGALAAVVGAALLGAVTVFLGNAPYATVAHWTMAMTLLAVLAMTTVRAGALGGPAAAGRGGSATTARLALLAAALAFLTVVMGGLTAKFPSAAVACQSFPLCGANPAVDGGAVAVQLTHRVLAYVVFFYLLVMAFALKKRGHAPVVVRVGRVAFGFAALQILVAGAMIGMHLPTVLRSLHEAVGVAVWLSTFTFAYLAKLGTRDAERVAQDESAEPAEGAERVPPAAPRAPTMAVIVARGADAL